MENYDYRDMMYHGELPILQVNELDILEVWHGNHGINQMQKLTEAIIEMNPRILDVMNADMESVEDEIYDGGLTDEQLDVHMQEMTSYRDGLYEGYSFVIGMFTAIHMARTNSDDIHQFISDYRGAIGYIPVATDEELQRVNLVITGQAPVEETDDSRLADRQNYAHIHFEEFVSQDTLFNNIYKLQGKFIEEAYEQDPKSSKREMVAHLAGYGHAVKNAVEMYIQSAEEKQFRALVQ